MQDYPTSSHQRVVRQGRIFVFMILVWYPKYIRGAKTCQNVDRALKRKRYIFGDRFYPSTERVARSGADECLVTDECGAGDQIVRGPLCCCASGGHLQAGGLSPLSFAYFSLRRQRKVGAAPHRGNANKPITKQGKANTAGKQHRRNANRPKRKQGKSNTVGKTAQKSQTRRRRQKNLNPPA
jgi:hypothetical protein